MSDAVARLRLRNGITLATMTAIRRSWRPPDEARLVAFSPGLARVAVLGVDGDIALIEPFVGAARTLHLELPTLALALADDGETLAVVDARRDVHIVPLAAPADARVIPARCGELLRQRVAPAPATERVSIAPHDLVLATGTDAALTSERTLDDQEEYYGGGWLTSSARTTLTRWRTGAARVLWTDDASHAMTYTVRDTERSAEHPVAAAFSSDGRRLGLLMREGRLALYDGEGAPLASIEGSSLRAFAFLPGDAGLVTASGARVVTRDLVGRPRHESSAPRDVAALASSPCGTWIACLDVAGGVTVLDAAEGAVVDALPSAHTGSPRAIAWLDDHLRIRWADDTLLELRHGRR